MSSDLFIDHAGRASSRSSHAIPASLDDWSVPGAERQDTQNYERTWQAGSVTPFPLGSLLDLILRNIRRKQRDWD